MFIQKIKLLAHVKTQHVLVCTSHREALPHRTWAHEAAFPPRGHGPAIGQATAAVPLGPGSWQLTSSFLLKLRKQWRYCLPFTDLPQRL